MRKYRKEVGPITTVYLITQLLVTTLNFSLYYEATQVRSYTVNVKMVVLCCPHVV
jgi:hypothetical protein